MAFANVKVNWASIRAKMSKGAETKGRAVARKKVYDLFYRAKRRLLRDFNTHLVTLEIEAGPTFGSKNISGTLEGYGNLFSFLGFNRGANPTDTVRQILTEETYYNPNPSYRNDRWTFRVHYPTRKRISQETEKELSRWDGNSWVDLIEKGAPGIVNYLNLKRSNSKSASNFGFQIPWEINDDLEFRPKRYLNEILENFRNRINNSAINDKN